MSIIYEALKKVEPALDKKKRQIPDISRHLPLIILVLTGFLAANLIFYLVVHLFAFAPATAGKPSAPGTSGPSVLPAILKPKPAEPRFKLNGVFFSQNGGYALINNRIVRQGDIIEDAKVTGIFIDGVELEINGEREKIYAPK